MNMGLVSVPNLDYGSALAFCREFETYKWDEENIFDFKNVYNCDPFPMLCVGSKIRKRRIEHSELACKAQNLHNDYATNMRFYRFIGIDKGRQLDLEYGNGNYQPISDLNLLNVLKESRQLNKPVGELVTNISEKLATVLARDDKIVKKTMTFCLREIIRNIPEHSNSLNGWYCAQYWPTKDLVELAIIDDGRGILESINSNYNYASERLTNEESIIKALQPGVSSTFDNSFDDEIFAGTGNVWKNSGYGLFMVSRICAKTGGSFVLASGDTAVKLSNDSKGKIIYNSNRTSIDGTAIRIQFKISGLSKIKDILTEINEERKHDRNDGFKTASKASQFDFLD